VTHSADLTALQSRDPTFQDLSSTGGVGTASRPEFEAGLTTTSSRGRLAKANDVSMLALAVKKDFTASPERQPIRLP
jgi:hypothetical protein